MVFFRPDGTLSAYPTEKSAARERKIKIYDSCESCPDCGAFGYRYVKNDQCVQCCLESSIAFYTESLAGGAPVTAQDAVARGMEYYVTEKPCSRLGHPGVRRATDHKCKFCIEEERAKEARLKARARAKARGDMFYTNGEKCHQCGTVGPRRVNNNSCRQCEINRSTKGAAIRQEADRGLMASCPDMVISRADAKALGMGVYRTGKLCKNNHRGFRYVSTGGCLECLRK